MQTNVLKDQCFSLFTSFQQLPLWGMNTHWMAFNPPGGGLPNHINLCSDANSISSDEEVLEAFGPPCWPPHKRTSPARVSCTLAVERCASFSCTLLVLTSMMKQGVCQLAWLWKLVQNVERYQNITLYTLKYTFHLPSMCQAFKVFRMFLKEFEFYR